jgi:predicted nucleic-acid-binding protein
MIGLDSDVLVRYLTQDDPRQSRRAAPIFEKQLTVANPGFISTVAIVETAWVLERAYGFASGEIAAALERILQIDVLVVEREEQVFMAMIVLQEGLGTFADALIVALGARAGCSRTLTFDRQALRIPGFAPA